MPLCDSSGTCIWAALPEPSAAVLPPGSAADVSEVSRFSCMKFLGVPWGLRLRRTEQKLALSLLPMLPSAHINRVGVRVVCFRSSMATPPILYLRFTASLAVAAQDSRPSRSLVFTRKALSSSTSCRFIPAHKHRHYTQNPPFKIAEGANRRRKLVLTPVTDNWADALYSFPYSAAVPRPCHFLNPLAAFRSRNGVSTELLRLSLRLLGLHSGVSLQPS